MRSISRNRQRLPACAAFFFFWTSAFWNAALGQAPPAPNPPPQLPPGAASQNTVPPPPPARPLVVIDPAHGGSESGALLNPVIPEKDVTLSFGRRLRQELASRGLSVAILRDADETLTVDQRAAMVNSIGPSLYIGIHASTMGSGLRFYTAMLPPFGENRGPFISWQTAQSSSLARSAWVQQQITASIQRSAAGISVRSLVAPIRPLNNLTVPALMVEVAPANGDVLQLASAEFQQTVCSQLANAIAMLAPALRARTASGP